MSTYYKPTKPELEAVAKALYEATTPKAVRRPWKIVGVASRMKWTMVAIAAVDLTNGIKMRESGN